MIFGDLKLSFKDDVQFAVYSTTKKYKVLSAYIGRNTFHLYLRVEIFLILFKIRKPSQEFFSPTLITLAPSSTYDGS